MGFKTDYSFTKRCNESSRVLSKYPDRIPVICEKSKYSKMNNIDKIKYLVPLNLTIGQFIYVIRKRMQLSSISNLYDEYSDTDGFLYLKYNEESVFGFE